METKRLRGRASAGSYCIIRSNRLHRERAPGGQSCGERESVEHQAEVLPAAGAEQLASCNKMENSQEAISVASARGLGADDEETGSSRRSSPSGGHHQLEAKEVPALGCHRWSALGSLGASHWSGPKLADGRPCRLAGLLLAFLWFYLIHFRPVRELLGRGRALMRPSESLGRVGLVWAALLLSAAGPQLVAGQSYKPEWPQKALEQEIFLLNLEDGYFGCQVNSSQDFLQLFELSRLCDGQPQCYLGTDELAAPLKCKSRSKCGSSTNSRGQEEPVACLNGVCLDGLCYCNDGFGGKSCDIVDENECKFRPCDVFAHCTNTMGSYYCSCFPGESQLASHQTRPS